MPNRGTTNFAPGPDTDVNTRTDFVAVAIRTGISNLTLADIKVVINFFKTSPQSSLTTIKTQPANDVVVAIFHDVFDRKRAETFKLWMAHLESEHTALREREIARKETEMQEKERKFQEKYEHLVEAGAMVLDRAKMLDEKERHLTEREKAQNERGYVLRPF